MIMALIYTPYIKGVQILYEPRIKIYQSCEYGVYVTL